MSDKDTDQRLKEIALAKALFEREPTPLERTIKKAFGSRPTKTEED